MSVINTNIQAMAAARALSASQEMLGRSLSRLSSGTKIVNPSDDAAGLAVSEKLDAQNRRVRAANTNVQNAISYIQTTDGFMSGMTKVLARMSELAILAKDVTKSTTDIDLYSQEFRALQDQLRQTIGGTTAQIGGTDDITTPLGQFNGIVLFGDDATVVPSTGDLTTPVLWGSPAVTAGSFSPGANMSVGTGVVISAGSTFGTDVSVGNHSTLDDVTVGDNVTIGQKAYIGTGSTLQANVTVGDNAYVGPGVTLSAGVVLEPGAVVFARDYPSGTVPAGTVVTKNDLMSSVTAGTYTAGAGSSIDGTAVVGQNTVLGTGVSIGAGTRIDTTTSAVGVTPLTYSAVTIGNNVTIGKNVYIAPGVTIGDNAIIPDGAVIIGNVPADTEVAGPAPAASPATNGLTVTIGQAVGQTMTVPAINLRDGGMGAIISQDTNGAFSLRLTDGDAIAKITAAIQDVATERASLGASQSRLELASTTLSVEHENLASAISRIRDVDVAQESTQMARYNILVQSGTAMLAQANQLPMNVLKLLQS